MTIAISGINITDNPGPGYGVARSLKLNGAKVLGLSYNFSDPGHHMPFAFDESLVLPYPTLGEEGIVNELIKRKGQKGLNFVIPCLDAELPIYIQNQERLAGLGIETFLPTPAQFKLRDKAELTQLAKQLEINYPKTTVINSLNDIYEESLSYPLFVKGRYYQAYQSFSQAQALELANKIALEWGFPILLQEPVLGEELNIVGVGDGEGSDLGLVMIKKLSTTSLGKVWSAVTIKNSELLKLTKKFLDFTKWRGPFELECLINDEGITLIEINPRFPAWTYFATGVGVNLPQRMIDFAQRGKRVNESDLNYEAGKLFVRYTEEIITDFDSKELWQGESNGKAI